MHPDYYRLLNVRRDASAEAIHDAYRRLARAYHPDQHHLKGSEPAAEHMKRLNAAYACLRDAGSREAYDRRLSVAVPPTIRRAILAAANQMLVRSGWREVRREGRDCVLGKGADRVGVRFLEVLDESEQARWLHWAQGLLSSDSVRCSVALACRVQAPVEPARALSGRRRRVTAIDLTESRAFGNPLEGAYRALFRPFVLD